MSRNNITIKDLNNSELSVKGVFLTGKTKTLSINILYIIYTKYVEIVKSRKNVLLN